MPVAFHMPIASSMLWRFQTLIIHGQLLNLNEWAEGSPEDPRLLNSYPFSKENLQCTPNGLGVPETTEKGL